MKAAEAGFSVLDRARTLERLSSETFDLLVIGGGINGAGIARDAAMRGLTVALVEKGDIGSGTSSKSSKLVHGGIRYLEHYEFGLVHEASIERRTLLNIAPHLVKPLGFLMPIFSGARHGPLFVNLGMWLYDALALFKNVRMHRSLRPVDFSTLAPSLRSADLRGGALFYDAQTDDARLTLETLRSAHAHGALAASYAEVTGFRVARGRVQGAEVTDRLGNGTFQVRAKTVVNATGPWSDVVRRRLDASSGEVLRTTKGIHIVLPGHKLPLENAVVLISPEDGRVIFAIPWEKELLVGTTDTDFEGDLDHVVAEPDEVDYLLTSLESYFPGCAVTRDDVLGTYAGVRPLTEEGDGANGTESSVSREHRILVESSGVLTLVGGKLTTYRKMSQQVVDRVVRQLKELHGYKTSAACRTAQEPIRGFLAGAAIPDPRGASHPELMRRFAEACPGDERSLLSLVDEDPKLAEPVTERSPYLKAEIAFSCRAELAATLPDLMIRRTKLFYREPDQGLSAAPAVAGVAAEHLGWTQEEKARQLGLFGAEVEASRAFRRRSGPVRG